MKKIEIEDFVLDQLNEMTFETLLQEFDLTPEEVFWNLYQNGLIDDEIIDGMKCL